MSNSLSMKNPIVISLVLGLCGCAIIYIDSRITYKKREQVFYYKLYLVIASLVYIGISLLQSSKTGSNSLSGIGSQRIMTGSPNF